MEEEDLDGWNAEFLEEALSGFTQRPEPVSAPAPSMTTISPPLPHAVQLQSAGHRKQIPFHDPSGFSPPRVLSQRVSVYNDASVDYSGSSVAAARTNSSTRRYDSEKDLEIDRLKKELERASKKLLDMEQECSKLKKGKSKSKETQTKNSHTEMKGQGATTVHASKRTNLEPDVATTSLNDRETNSTTGVGDKRSFKTTGVQADMDNHADLSKKLQDIWGASNYQDPRKNLISELLLACSTDLQILYSFMKTNGPPQGKDRQGAKTLSNMQSSEALESEKVHQLHSAVTKISYGFVDLKTLFEPLLDLCKAENAVLVDRSLRVLHVLLEHICGFEKKFEASGKLDAESSRRSQGDTDKALPSWDPNWHSLFELMNQIASKRTEENVKLEAVSIMNIVVMRTDAYTMRENFVSKEVFESIALLLKKEAGLRVRREAIHLFYLLLNCPKVLASFDSSLHDEKKSSDSGNHSEGNLFALEAFGLIFEGLADCLTFPRKTSEDLELCRNVIKILALAASSGNSGYELLSNHKLPQDANYLMLILHILAAELESESTEAHPNDEIFKARTLLMREILILLNRLVSGSSSSSTILRELTKSRDMASLTVDAATRLSRKKSLIGEPESSVQRMRETEILDLARIFKRRVFAFLGDGTS
ncbi:unnamed protein product [Microthlaspi erraticum]|uniref:Uncharacterized protein n=1 Tax=Microthlaspi erraticum TaxID=1685480 RepID=A0A6D2HD95_9BRAS|nr:unnamed protein product [Microthlaspi erraticum]